MDVKIGYDVQWASQVTLVVKNLCVSAGDVRDTDLMSRSGKSPGGGHDNPLQYSCLRNPKDRGAWKTIVLGVAKESDTTEVTNSLSL